MPEKNGDHASEVGNREEADSAPDADDLELRCELIIGLVGAIGTDLERPAKELRAVLWTYGYDTIDITVSDTIREVYGIKKETAARSFRYLAEMIRAGNQMCEDVDDEAALADAGIARIRQIRGEKETLIRELCLKRDRKKQSDLPPRKRAFVLRSLKRPQELERLRGVYGGMFYAIGVFADRAERAKRLTRSMAEDGSERDRIAQENAQMLINVDENEVGRWGQKVSDTFTQVDYIVRSDAQDEVRDALERFIPLVFAKPHITPRIAEVGMMHAYVAGLRSADLSRQIGAVVVARDGRILVTGCNEVPRGGGGQYWESDINDRRDFKTGEDINDRKKRDAMVEVLARLKSMFKTEFDLMTPAQLYADILDKGTIAGTTVDSLIEFGRVSHAEMSALTSATLQGVSLRDCDLYSTTFPCHMCTRLIIACGIRNVFYIEPYPKSAALQMYGAGEIEVNPVLTPSQLQSRLFAESVEDRRTHFLPFDGVAPRRYTELFSKSRSKDKRIGSVLDFVPTAAKPRRTPEFTVTYATSEAYLANRWDRRLEKLRQKALERGTSEPGEQPS